MVLCCKGKLAFKVMWLNGLVDLLLVTYYIFAKKIFKDTISFVCVVKLEILFYQLDL